ncbi:G2 and S phase-expressed protein 1 isoform X2 [Monodelphis domestica]|uniref:G2 and S phase-expressed protein 1 isoform X2 n=1 Tax=Monodelphis domestica TaxID=13616 RepID=UPI0004432FFF|nr:G2 and S phase-expressed protein 1 isoform X2 [Monodelphis domestica]
MKEGEEGLVRGTTKEGASVDTQNELPLLTDEKFDFDLSPSSSSANEDDEVFFGPVGHRERCVAASLELQGFIPKEAESPLTWSPLAGEKYVEIFKEARLLALQIESSGRKTASGARSPEPAPDPREEFVREARLKLAIFEQGQEAHRSPLALKRETYCVLTPEAAAVPASLTFADSPEAPEPTASGSQILNQGVAERKAPSRLQLPKASSTPGKGTPAKPQLGKQTHPLRLPLRGSRVSLGTEPSNQSSSTSKFGAKKTLLKPPGPPRTLLGGKSASFSGPVCSVNLTSNWSSLGTPGQSKAKPSEASSRWPNTPRPRLSQGSVSYLKDTRMAQVSTPLAGRTRESASVSLRQPQTPRTGIQRPGSNPSLSQSSQPVKPKGPRGPSSSSKVPANPAGHLALSVGPSPDNAAPRVQGWSRLPAGPSSRRVSLLSTPAQCSSVGGQPLGSCARTPLSARRMSALPTPSRRRVSALPSWSTPGTGLRTASSPKLVAAQPPSQVLPKKTEGRPEQAQETRRLGASRLSDPPLVVPLALDFASPPQTVSKMPGEETKEQPVPPEAVLIHIEPEPCATIPATPRPPLCSQPLIDFSNSPEMAPRGLPLKPAMASEGQLLIDLFHSPEVAQSIPPKPLPPVTGQLIDLSSPLISLSPLEDKENQASPLLRL